jgi:exopolyphosphatase/guanosine-5'-triphosphate,3'-diphosphate pyrophosphatase
MTARPASLLRDVKRAGMNSNSPEKRETVAVIDVGTNSVKLVITDVSPSGGDCVEKKFMRETTRIGEGVAATREISAPALLRTVNAIERFRRIVQQYDCDHVFAFSTYAFRLAGNGEDAAARIEDETGIAVRILSGAEEAEFAHLSARTRLVLRKPHTYLIDVGGGSVEFVHASRDRVLSVRSLPLGALHLTERFLPSDPIGDDEFARLRTYVRNTVSLLFEGSDLAGHRARIPASQSDMVASGGSVTTIKKMCDASTLSSSVTSPKLRIGDVRALEKQCLSLTLEKRKRLPGIEPDRADIIPAGLAVVIAFMEAASKRVVIINPGGVRDGVLIHLIQNSFRW